MPVGPQPVVQPVNLEGNAQCTSCKMQKPRAEFSGKATCDVCRPLKRAKMQAYRSRQAMKEAAVRREQLPLPVFGPAATESASKPAHDLASLAASAKHRTQGERIQRYMATRIAQGQSAALALVSFAASRCTCVFVAGFAILHSLVRCVVLFPRRKF